MEKISKKIEAPFVQVANNVLTDKELSFKAKGLFAYIYSKPVGWKFSSHRIAQDTLDSRDSIRSGLKELENQGYLKPNKLKSGHIEYQITYIKDIKAKDGKSHRGKTRPISNKEESHNNKECNDFSKEKSDTKNTMYKEDERKFSDEFVPVIDYETGLKTERPAPTDKATIEMKANAKAIFDYYRNLYTKFIITDRPVFIHLSPKIRKLLYTALRRYGKDRLTQLLEAYINSDTPLFKKASWSIDVFLSSSVLFQLDTQTPIQIRWLIDKNE